MPLSRLLALAAAAGALAAFVVLWVGLQPPPLRAIDPITLVGTGDAEAREEGRGAPDGQDRAGQRREPAPVDAPEPRRLRPAADDPAPQPAPAPPPPQPVPQRPAAPAGDDDDDDGEDDDDTDAEDDDGDDDDDDDGDGD